MTDNTKDGIRARAKSARRALSPEEVGTMSRRITDILTARSEFRDAKCVMTYLSAFKEPDTAEILRRAFAAGKRVVVPISNIEDFTITPSYISSLDGLKKGAYGISEPVRCVPARADEIDLALIPGIAFDRRGHRIGFGKGYYDRFLAEFSGIKLGICYDFQMLDFVPTSEHDVKMDMIITERGVYNDF